MKTVLFVDDERFILNAIRRLYQKRGDLRCLFASSGPEGLEILKREEVCVVVSDYLMPAMHGIEFLDRVRSIQPDTTRIMMTSHNDFSIAVDAINKSEVHRFIKKPWDNKELTDIVDEAMLNYDLIKSLKTKDETVYLSLAQTVELKDSYTKGHCDRVGHYATSLASAALLDANTINEIKYGSWLHDCGKIGVPDIILNSPDRLSEDDMNTIMKHPLWGANVARQARMSQTVVNIILYHHERYDGTGYPSGLKGEFIPIEARIVTLADVFDSLYTDRPYRKAYDCRRVSEIMMEMAKTYFDPRLMELFLPIIESVGTNSIKA